MNKTSNQDVFWEHFACSGSCFTMQTNVPTLLTISLLFTLRLEAEITYIVFNLRADRFAFS